MMEVVDEIKLHVGPVWGPTQHHKSKHEMFVKPIMKESPTTTALGKLKNKWKAIMIATSMLLELIIAHLDKFNDDCTPMFNYFIYWQCG